MTRDYGGVSAQRAVWARRVGIVVAAALVTALLAANWTHQQAKALATAKDWTIDGPPCPSLTRAAYEARGLHAKRVFEYDDVRLARQNGHVSCEEVAYDGGRGRGVFPVCQFTSPAVLEVKTARGEFFFEPGIGRPATISVPHGVARCVMASKFSLN